MVLQAIIESATGGTYQEAVQATPGADNVGASADACADVARGHRFAGPFTWPMDTGYDGAGAAYGYACGSIGDLAGFAASQLGSAEGIVGKLPDAQPTSTPGQLYEPGWRISMEPHRPTTVGHTGTVPGYFSAIYLDPESGDGAAVLLNASGYLREEALADLTAFAYDEATGPAAEKSFTDAPPTQAEWRTSCPPRCSEWRCWWSPRAGSAAGRSGPSHGRSARSSWRRPRSSRRRC